MNSLNVITIIGFIIASVCWFWMLRICKKQLKTDKAVSRMFIDAHRILSDIKIMANHNDYAACLMRIKDFDTYHKYNVPKYFLDFQRDSLFTFAQHKYKLLQFQANKHITNNPQNDY